MVSEKARIRLILSKEGEKEGKERREMIRRRICPSCGGDLKSKVLYQRTTEEWRGYGATGRYEETLHTKCGDECKDCGNVFNVSNHSSGSGWD